MPKKPRDAAKTTSSYAASSTTASTVDPDADSKSVISASSWGDETYCPWWQTTTKDDSDDDRDHHNVSLSGHDHYDDDEMQSHSSSKKSKARSLRDRGPKRQADSQAMMIGHRTKQRLAYDPDFRHKAAAESLDVDPIVAADGMTAILVVIWFVVHVLM